MDKQEDTALPVVDPVRTCATCCHGQKVPTGSYNCWQNECRRHAPSLTWFVTPDGSSANSKRPLWPITSLDDFCGEWAARQEVRSPVEEEQQ